MIEQNDVGNQFNQIEHQQQIQPKLFATSVEVAVPPLIPRRIPTAPPASPVFSPPQYPPKVTLARQKSQSEKNPLKHQESEPIFAPTIPKAIPYPILPQIQNRDLPQANPPLLIPRPSFAPPPPPFLQLPTAIVLPIPSGQSRDGTKESEGKEVEGPKAQKITKSELTKIEEKNSTEISKPKNNLSGNRSALMDEIREGIQLKKFDPSLAPQTPTSPQQAGGIFDALADHLAARRSQIKDDSDDDSHGRRSNDESDGSEWDD